MRPSGAWCVRYLSAFAVVAMLSGCTDSYKDSFFSSNQPRDDISLKKDIPSGPKTAVYTALTANATVPQQTVTLPIVIDNSGSMRPDIIRSVTQALSSTVTSLRNMQDVEFSVAALPLSLMATQLQNSGCTFKYGTTTMLHDPLHKLLFPASANPLSHYSQRLSSSCVGNGTGWKYKTNPLNASTLASITNQLNAITPAAFDEEPTLSLAADYLAWRQQERAALNDTRTHSFLPILITDEDTSITFQNRALAVYAPNQQVFSYQAVERNQFYTRSMCVKEDPNLAADAVASYGHPICDVHRANGTMAHIYWPNGTTLQVLVSLTGDCQFTRDGNAVVDTNVPFSSALSSKYDSCTPKQTPQWTIANAALMNQYLLPISESYTPTCYYPGNTSRYGVVTESDGGKRLVKYNCAADQTVKVQAGNINLLQVVDRAELRGADPLPSDVFVTTTPPKAERYWKSFPADALTHSDSETLWLAEMSRSKWGLVPRETATIQYEANWRTESRDMLPATAAGYKAFYREVLGLNPVHILVSYDQACAAPSNRSSAATELEKVVRDSKGQRISLCDGNALANLPNTIGGMIFSGVKKSILLENQLTQPTLDILKANPAALLSVQSAEGAAVAGYELEVKAGSLYMLFPHEITTASFKLTVQTGP